MIFKSINKANSLIALIILAIGFYLLESQIYKEITMYSLFFAGLLSIFVLKINFKDLFKPLRKKDILIIFLCFIFSIILSGLSASLLKYLNIQTAANPAISEMGTTFSSVAIRLIKTLPQLLGEEFITLIPFLMIIRFATFKGLSEKKSAIIALVLTSIAFGLLHLKTYNWNLMQCLIVISLARIPFTLAYIKSKNLIVPWLTHVVFDWFNFIIVILLLQH